MARIRTVKPEFMSSPDTARLSRDARLFFLQMLCHLDDEGRRRWLPKEVAGLLYPYDEDVTAATVSAWAAECASTPEPMLLVYTVDGHDYICAPKFTEHQRISHPQTSKCPAPSACAEGLRERSGKVPEDLRNDSAHVPEDCAPGSRKLEVGSRKLEVGKGNVRSAAADAAAADLAAQVDGWCEFLAGCMVANGCKPPTVTPAWRNAAAQLVRLDKRDPSEVETLLRWCQQNDFWRSNILSMPKFREKYDQLRLQWQREARASPAKAGTNPALDATLVWRRRRNLPDDTKEVAI